MQINGTKQDLENLKRANANMRAGKPLTDNQLLAIIQDVLEGPTQKEAAR